MKKEETSSDRQTTAIALNPIERAIEERHLVSERASVVMTVFAVVVTDIIYLVFLDGKPGSHPTLAYSIMTCTAILTLAVLFSKKLRKKTLETHTYVISLFESSSLILWMYAAGSYTPFFALYFAMVILISFRQKPVETLVSTAIYSTQFVAWLIITDQFLSHLYEHVVWLSYLWLTATITAMFSRFTLGQMIGKFSLEKLNNQLSNEIAENKKTSRELNEAYQRIKDLYDNAPCGYCSLDANAIYVDVNDKELEWIGYSREEVVGKLSFRNLLTEKSKVTLDANFEILKIQGYVNEIEFEIIRKDGSLFYMLLNSVAVYDNNGNFLKTRTTSFDITYRKNIEQKLSDTKNTLQSILDNAPSVVFLKDTKGKFLLVNNELNKLIDQIRINDLDIIGHTSSEVLPANVAERFDTYDKQVLDTKSSVLVDSFSFPIKVNFFPLKDENGNVYAIGGIGIDISNEIENEKKISGLNKKLSEKITELELAYKELDAFTHTVSHDLKAPLRSINGFAHMFNEDYAGKMDPQQEEYINLIANSAQKMAVLIDDLLTFSKLGRQVISKVSLDMKGLVKSVASEVLKNSEAANVKLVVNELPQAGGDQNLISQVLYNLLANSVKFSSKNPAPEIIISGEIKGDEFVFSIKDNGVGFNMKYIDKLFGVFHRLHSAKDFSGTGIGLSIVKTIIERHGGKVWAESEEGKGAIFYFSLPR